MLAAVQFAEHVVLALVELEHGLQFECPHRLLLNDVVHGDEHLAL